MPPTSESLVPRLVNSRMLPTAALALAIAAGVWLGLDWWRHLSPPLQTGIAAPAPIPAWDVTAGTLADARLFGGDAAAAAPAVASDIRLKGVFAGMADRGSAAIVHMNGRDLHAAVGGELLPGIKLVSVQPRSITVQRNGALQQVALDEPQRAPAAAPAVAQATPQSPAPAPAGTGTVAPSPAARGLAEQRARRGEAYAPVGDVTTDAPAPAAATPPPPPPVRSSPAATPGSAPAPGNAPAPAPAPRSGVPATDLLASDALARFGLQPGDMIQSVNGRAVSSRFEVARLATELRGQPVSVQIARGGEVVSVQFTSP